MFSKLHFGLGVWLTACGGLTPGKLMDSGNSRSETSADDTQMPSTGDDTANPGDIRYPSSIQNSILLYTGHGGATSGESTGRGGFYTIGDHWGTLGWNTHKLETFPEVTDLDFYRMVGLMAPGFTDTVAFTELEVIKLKTLLHDGARVVVFAEEHTCDNPHLNTLLAELEVSIRFTGEGMGLNSVVNDADIATGHQLTRGVEVIRFTDPCYIEANDGEILASRRRAGETRVFMAVERPGRGGDVVVIGDFQFLDDSGMLTMGDNLTLSANLANVVPE